jgi:hypothetical protein
MDVFLRQRDLSVSNARAGDVLAAESKKLEASTSYHDGLAIMDLLAKAEPGNAGWQHDLAVSHAKLADVSRRATIRPRRGSI